MPTVQIDARIVSVIDVAVARPRGRASTCAMMVLAAGERRWRVPTSMLRGAAARPDMAVRVSVCSACFDPFSIEIAPDGTGGVIDATGGAPGADQ